MFIELPSFCRSEVSYIQGPLKSFEAQINVGIAYQRFCRAAVHNQELAVPGADLSDLAAWADATIDEAYANAQHLCDKWQLRLRIRYLPTRCMVLEVVA